MAAEGNGLVAVGLSHHTAPVEIRERLALDDEGVRAWLRRLLDEGVADEALLVSTCNRVELYVVPSGGDLGPLRDWFGGFRTTSGEAVDRYLYWHTGPDAVRHLFRVASSLDSLVVGEPQILGQVKSAVRAAQESGSLGKVLGRLSQRSLVVAKRVRTETDIGRARVGVGNAGVDLARQIFGELKGHRALLVGTGEMGRQVAKALLGAGLGELLVANRTFETAIEVAKEHGGTPIPIDRLEEYLDRVDVVIAATAAPKPILGADAVRRAIRRRWYRPMFLVDLAVPRNIDPAVSQISEAYLFNVDDLVRVVEEGREARFEASRAAAAIVDEEAERFLHTLAEADVNPRIGGMTQRAEALRLAEIARSRRLVDGLDETSREALDAMTRALVKKVLHGPIQAIRSAAREGDTERVDALLRAFEESKDE